MNTEVQSEKPRSVLIVEDERIVAKDLQQTLVEMGYDAFAIAASADEALRAATERCPDVVLMDIRLKGDRDGIETARLLRERFNVPIIFVTAHADEVTLSRASVTEAFGYLVKPIRPVELRGALEVSLYKHAMEARLRKRERWFSTTLRSIADAVVAVDLAGKVTFMNPAAEALTGHAFSEAEGEPARDILRLSNTPGDSPLERALRHKQNVTLFEGVLERRTGDERIISDCASPVVDEEQLLGAVMVFRDVTAEKSLQKQLELSDRLASLGTMAAGVAHEINNPLAVLTANGGFVRLELDRARKLLGDDAAATPADLKKLEEAEQAQADSLEAASRIARVVGDLQVFARPPEGKPGRANLGRAIRLAVRSTAAEMRDKCQVVVDAEELPDLAIDEQRLGQVLVNLLINAAHAIAAGRADTNRITLSARAIDASTVEISVSDTGSGMTPEVLERVFDPFFTTRPIGKGTGLGLSICKGIVQSARGQLTAASRPGAGSVFRLTLPTAGPLEGPVEPEVIDDAPVGGQVLLIDDEPLVARAIQRALKGYEVTAVNNAADGLTLLLEGKRFDLILCDVMMPNRTGPEFYEQLAKLSPDHAPRVVFLTGGVTDPALEAFLAATLNPTLLKPFSPQELRVLVKRLLAR